ncbi:MAG: ROK family protein [Wujia sp.]
MYLIFDVGGTFIKYAWMSEEAEIKEKGKIPTGDHETTTVESFIDSLVSIYTQYKEKGKIDGIALSLPGLIDGDNGYIRNGGALKYLKNVEFVKLLRERCDNVNITIENDANCAALAEVWKGNAKDCKNAVLVILGTGIGGAVVIDRHVYHGNHLSAGEFSFIFSDNFKRSDLGRIQNLDEINDLEEEFEKLPFLWGTTFSTRAMVFQVCKAKGLNPKEYNGEDVYRWAQEKDPIAIDILEDFYFAIAKYLFGIAATMDPDVVLLGGGISANPALLEGVMRYVNKMRAMSEINSFLKVDVCKFHNDSNLIGALYNHLQRYENK